VSAVSCLSSTKVRGQGPEPQSVWQHQIAIFEWLGHPYSRGAATVEVDRPQGEEIEDAAERDTPQSLVGQLFLKTLPIMAARGYLGNFGLLQAASVCKEARWDVETWERVVKLRFLPEGETSSSEGATILSAASCVGPLERAEWLLHTCKADIEAEASTGRRPIHYAAREGQTAILHMLLSAGAGPHARDKSGCTPLHWSCHRGHFEASMALVSAGAYIEVEDDDRDTPLLCAGHGENEDLCLALLDCGAIASVENLEGMTPLHHAAANGHLRVLNRLLPLDEAALNAQNNDGQTALYLACREGHEGIAVKLLDLKANIDTLCSEKLFEDGDFTCLHAAGASGNVSLIGKLIDGGLDVNSYSGNALTPLHLALRRGRLAAVKELLRRGADVNARRWNFDSPLEVAIKSQDEELLDVLLTAKADVNKQCSQGWSALHQAASTGGVPILDKIIKAGANLELKVEMGSTAVWIAARAGRVAAVERLIEAKCNLNAHDGHRHTSLHNAIRWNHPEVVACLLKAGANIAVRTEDGLAAADYAVSHGHQGILEMITEAQTSDLLAVACKNEQLEMIDHLLSRGPLSDIALSRQRFLLHKLRNTPCCQSILEKLLEYGFPVDIPDQNGQTPLLLAAAEWSASSISSLVRFGADLEARDNKRRTPLFMAAISRRFSNLLQLLQLGADPNSTADDGRSPLIATLEVGASATASLLLRHGASIETARICLHNRPFLWPEEAQDALILHLIDRRQLLPLGRPACSPDALTMVNEALNRFATSLSGADTESLAIPPYRQLLRWLLGIPCANLPEVVLPALPEPAPFPADVKPEEYRDKRLAMLREETWERRGRLVCFFGKAQKSRATGNEGGTGE
jgi:ankyrin repeat protein